MPPLVESSAPAAIMGRRTPSDAVPPSTTPDVVSTVHVRIGRIDVRAVSSRPAPSGTAETGSAAVSLRDYLDQRDRSDAK